MRIAMAVLAFCLGIGQAGAATYVVDSLGDSSLQSACTSAANDCSLRGAISRANADPKPDTVDFNVPSNLCGSTCVINIGQQLAINQPLTIDASTQPGYVANTIPARDGPINTIWKIEVRLNNVPLVTNQSTTLRGLLLPIGEIYDSAGASPPTIAIEGSFIGDATDLNNSLRMNFSNSVVRIGGLNSSLRNVIVSYIFVRANSGQSLVQGNLIGVAPDASTMYFAENFNQLDSARVTLALTGNAQMLFGGADPEARNIVGLRNATFSASSTSSSPIRILGNFFGIGANGVRFGAKGALLAENAEVGGIEPGAANQFASIFETIRMYGRGSFLGNAMDGGTSHGITIVGGTFPFVSYLPNDANDADFLQQNTPEIISFNNIGDQVSLTYGVDSTTSNSNFPLLVQFFKSENRNPKTLLFTDSYTAADAQQAKSINFTLPAGVSLTSTDVIVAIANGNDFGGPSVTSFYPVTYSFVGTPQLLLNMPSPIRVRALSTGPFFPRGAVLVTAGGQNSCLATLIPTGMVGLSEGQCNITGITALTNYPLRASAGGFPEPFIGSAILSNVIAIDDNLFCDGFENPLRCAGR